LADCIGNTQSQSTLDHLKLIDILSIDMGFIPNILDAWKCNYLFFLTVKNTLSEKSISKKVAVSN